MQGTPEGTAGSDALRPRRKLWRWVLFVAILGAAGWFLFAPRSAIEPEVVTPEGATVAQEASRATLFFGDAESRGWVSEERDIPATTTTDARIAAVIRALVEGPRDSEGVRTFPANVALRRVFLDEQAATVYLDFDPTLVTGHPGGTTAESMTLGSIARTMGANFPDIARVQLLVDGEPVETLAGHVDASQPLEIEAWK